MTVYIKVIKDEAKKKGFSLKELAKKIGMSEQGLHAAFKNNTLKVEYLVKIAGVLDIDLSKMFEQVNFAQNKVDYSAEKIVHDMRILFITRQRLMQKVSLVQEMIEQYTNQLANNHPDFLFKDFAHGINPVNVRWGHPSTGLHSELKELIEEIENEFSKRY